MADAFPVTAELSLLDLSLFRGPLQEKCSNDIESVSSAYYLDSKTDIILLCNRASVKTVPHLHYLVSEVSFVATLLT